MSKVPSRRPFIPAAAFLAVIAGLSIVLAAAPASADRARGIMIRECHELAVRPVARAWRLIRHLEKELAKIEAEIQAAQVDGCIDAARRAELDAALLDISQQISDALLELDLAESHLAECLEFLSSPRLGELVVERTEEARAAGFEAGFLSLELQQALSELPDC